MKNYLLFLVLFYSFALTQAQTFSTNTTPVGLEHNILFNAHERFTVTQTGPPLNLPALFDGRFLASYTPTGPSTTNPTVVTIEDLPAIHSQAGVWMGWSTRYWQTKNFKIEAFDEHNDINRWRIVADYSSTDYTGGTNFSVKFPGGGRFTKLRYTFYSAIGTNGRLGISELFFIHPEATRPYEALGLGAWKKEGSSIKTEAINTIFAHPTSNHTSLQIGRESNDRIIADNNDTSSNSYGSGYFFRVHDESATHGYRNSMYLASNGNIGIGKKPTARLEVNGTTKIQGHTDGAELLRFESDRPWSFINSGTAAGSRLQLQSNVDSKFFDIVALEGNKVASFFTSNNTNTQKVILVENGGSVGIGTDNTQGYKLGVAGKIAATEVKVALYENWPDFVFSKDYNLPSLQEVETYINTQGHLPNIPSAKEVTTAKGIELGEMNRILVQKIEELTLYTIEQEKKLEKMKVLEARLARLENLLK